MPDELPNYIGDGGGSVQAMPIHAPTIAPALSFYSITPSTDALDPAPKALWANQACTITMAGLDGTSLTFTVDGAGPIPIAPVKVTAVSTGTVFALHDGAA